MSPLSNNPDVDAPDLTNALAALTDYVRALAARVGTVEASLSGKVGTGAGVPGPAGSPGEPGAPGPPGTSEVDDDSGLQSAIDSLTSRVNALESGVTSHPTGSLGPYYDAILADNPVGFWPLCESDVNSRIFYDHSGNHLTGTVDQGGIPIQFGGPNLILAQPNDKSISFPERGQSQYARVSGGIGGKLNDPNGQSIEFWVQVDDFPHNFSIDYHTMSYVHMSDVLGDFDNYVNDLGGDGKNYSCFCDVPVPDFPVTDTTILPFVTNSLGLTGEPSRGVPHQYVYTRKTGGLYSIYIDGVLTGDGTRPAGTFSVGDGSLIIGGNPGRGNSMVGSVGYVSVYNYELTADQVHHHYLKAIGG